MKLPARIFLVIGVLLLALAVAFLTPKPEPKHNGRVLRDWLIQSLTNYPRRDHDVALALNAMGEEAVRSLVKTAEDQDSPLKQKLIEYSEKLPMLSDTFSSKLWWQLAAVKALGEMGTNAVSAIPTLRKLEASSDKTLASAARAALVLIENQPIEPLAREYFEGTGPNSPRAFGTLLQLGPHATAAIPVVLKNLQSTNERVRLGAVSLLSHIGVESPECVAVFTNLLADPSHLMHILALNALANSGDSATSSAPAVIELLDDPEGNCRHAVLGYLWRVIPPESFDPFRSKVQKAVRDSDPNVRESAEQVLRAKRPAK